METGEMLHKIDDKVWFSCAVMILEKTDEYIAFRICRDTPTMRAADKEGKVLRLGCDEWTLKEQQWRDNDLTYIFPYEDYIGYGILTNKEKGFISYYLNFQDKVKIEGNKIITLDFELDFVVTDFDKRIFAWKDVEEFEKLRKEKFFKTDHFDDFEYDEEEMFFKLEKYKRHLDRLSAINTEKGGL